MKTSHNLQSNSHTLFRRFLNFCYYFFDTNLVMTIANTWKKDLSNFVQSFGSYTSRNISMNIFYLYRLPYLKLLMQQSINKTVFWLHLSWADSTHSKSSSYVQRHVCRYLFSTSNNYLLSSWYVAHSIKRWCMFFFSHTWVSQLFSLYNLNFLMAIVQISQMLDYLYIRLFRHVNN